MNFLQMMFFCPHLLPLQALLLFFLEVFLPLDALALGLLAGLCLGLLPLKKRRYKCEANLIKTKTFLHES